MPAFVTHTFVHPKNNLTLFQQIYTPSAEKPYTIVHHDAPSFVDSLLNEHSRGTGFLRIKEQPESSMSVVAVLQLFCMECATAGVGMSGETSVWKHTEGGNIYIVAWTFDDGDYYSSAYSYIERVHPFF